MNNAKLSGDYEKAKDYALYLMGMRDHSSGELLKKMSRRFTEKASRDALLRLRELGWQDDKKYALKLAVHLIDVKKYGIRKARYEMKLKGLCDEDINEALEDFDSEIIIENIVRFIEKKYSDCLSDRQGVKKTIDALMRRGYEYGEIKEAVEKCKADIELDYD